MATCVAGWRLAKTASQTLGGAPLPRGPQPERFSHRVPALVGGRLATIRKRQRIRGGALTSPRSRLSSLGAANSAAFSCGALGTRRTERKEAMHWFYIEWLVTTLVTAVAGGLFGSLCGWAIDSAHKRIAAGWPPRPMRSLGDRGSRTARSNDGDAYTDCPCSSPSSCAS